MSRIVRMATPLVLGCLAFLAAWTGARASSSSSGTDPMNRKGYLCTGGPANPIDVRLYVTAPGRWELRVRSDLKGPALSQYALEFTDDAGNPIGPPLISEPDSLLHDAAFVRTLDAPKDLSDGFYQIRVTTVATDGESDASDLSVGYFAVTDGVATQISHAQWINSTRAGMATHVPESR